MQEKDEQAETFNQDQQEMFQHPDANLGETRPRPPGAEELPALPIETNEPMQESAESEEAQLPTIRRAESNAP